MVSLDLINNMIMAALAGYSQIKYPHPDSRYSLLCEQRMSAADMVFLILVFLVWLATQTCLMGACWHRQD